MSDPEPAEHISVYGVTPEFFTILGIRALHGRVLLPEDASEQVGMPPAVLSYAFWRRRFRGDPQVVSGGSIVVNRRRFLIVGVMAQNVNGLAIDTTPDVRVPWSAFTPFVKFDVNQLSFELAGRLKPGVTRLKAEAECNTIWRSVMRDHYQNVLKLPSEDVSAALNRGMRLDELARGASILRDRFGEVLKLLMASVSIVVLIMCTNVAGLLLARSTARRHEIAVRLALGADRLRLVRHILSESFWLGVLGVGTGLLLAFAAMPWALRTLPPIRDSGGSLVPLAINAGINWRVFMFLVLLSALTALIFSLSPCIAACRSSTEGLLRAARSSSRLHGRHVLLTVQIALSTAMLAGAGLFLRTLYELRRTDPGFDRDHIATFSGYLGTSSDAAGLARRLTEQVSEIPGVVSAAISSIGVMRGRGVSATVAPAGERIRPADFMNTNVNYVSLNYFDTMGMNIVAGRDFTPEDESEPASQGPIKAVVNQTFARRFFPNADAVGRRFGVGVESVAIGKYEIIGIVGDAKYRSIKEPVKPAFYTLTTRFDSFVLNVRTRVSPESIIESVQKVLRSIDPNVPFVEVHTLAEEVEESFANERLTAALVSLFGAVSALLAGVGIYGLLVYVVTQRRREIGIRIALGAGPGQIGWLIARQTVGRAAIGVALGLGAALMAEPAIRSMLYGIPSRDPRSLGAAAIFIGVVAAAGTLIPAVRAMRTAPAETLRHEN